MKDYLHVVWSGLTRAFGRTLAIALAGAWAFALARATWRGPVAVSPFGMFFLCLSIITAASFGTLWQIELRRRVEAEADRHLRALKRYWKAEDEKDLLS